jgi:nucleotide-binding universal stress UspA family protein
MIRMLVPVDGSENSQRAVKWLVKRSPMYAEPLHVHLLNVQPAFRGVMRGLHGAAQQLHKKHGMQALSAARKLLEEAGIEYDCHIAVGDAAHIIYHYAKDNKVRHIVMGTRGLGAIAGLLMGSVTLKVIHLADRPVLLVK